MPKKLKIYDKKTGEAIERFAVTANEAVQNDPGRYSFHPQKAMSAKDKKAAEGAKAQRTTSGPLKASPVGREDTGGRTPDDDSEIQDQSEREKDLPPETVRKP